MPPIKLTYQPICLSIHSDINMKLSTIDQTPDIQSTTPTHQTFDIQPTTPTHQTELSRDIRLKAQILRDID